MVIIIGDAAPNTLKDVEEKRKHVADKIVKNRKYWS
jgi:hypothetical protein